MPYNIIVVADCFSLNAFNASHEKYIAVVGYYST